MDSLQFLLNKIIEVGNLLSSAVTRIDQNSDDISETSADLEKLSGRLDGMEKTIGTFQREHDDREKRIAARPTNAQAVIMAITALVSAGSAIIAYLSLRAQLYLMAHLPPR